MNMSSVDEMISFIKFILFFVKINHNSADIIVNMDIIDSYDKGYDSKRQHLIRSIHGAIDDGT